MSSIGGAPSSFSKVIEANGSGIVTLTGLLNEIQKDSVSSGVSSPLIVIGIDAVVAPFGISKVPCASSKSSPVSAVTPFVE